MQLVSQLVDLLSLCLVWHLYVFPVSVWLVSISTHSIKI